MSPLSTTVLGGATLLASPALYQSLVDGTLPLDVALTRFLVALVVCWLAFTVLTEFVLPRPAPQRPPEPIEILEDDASAPDPLFDAPASDVADAVSTVAAERALKGPAT